MPMFLSQFLGALNDNLLRSALVVLISYSAQRGITLPFNHPVILVTLCSALLIMPFILFSGIAGQLADKLKKGTLVTYIKLAEIVIMSIALLGFIQENVILLMVMLFISGTHSTFFGPIKYSILPELLKRQELLAGNGFISAGTFVGILLGLISGALLIDLGTEVVGIALLTIACIGFVASLFIPRYPASMPDVKISWHLWQSTKHIMHQARRTRSVFYAILALSWFLMIGSVYMAQFANYASAVVQADNHVYTLFLVLFSVGIALGSMTCDLVLKGNISAHLTPYALIGISIFSIGMVAFTPVPTHEGLMDIVTFILQPSHYPFLFCMLMVSFCGGVYMVPLYAILQTRCDPHYRSRVIAASNVVDSVFMTTAAIICVILLSIGFRITDLFLLLGILNIGVWYRARKMVKA